MAFHLYAAATSMLKRYPASLTHFKASALRKGFFNCISLSDGTVQNHDIFDLQGLKLWIREGGRKKLYAQSYSL